MNQVQGLTWEQKEKKSGTDEGKPNHSSGGYIQGTRTGLQTGASTAFFGEM